MGKKMTIVQAVSMRILFHLTADSSRRVLIWAYDEKTWNILNHDSLVKEYGRVAEDQY
jgi:hypothetical protein